MAFYIGTGNFMVEMETMGKEVTLKHKEKVFSKEIWTLTDKSLGFDNLKKILEV